MRSGHLEFIDGPQVHFVEALVELDGTLIELPLQPEVLDQFAEVVLEVAGATLDLMSVHQQHAKLVLAVQPMLFVAVDAEEIAANAALLDAQESALTVAMLTRRDHLAECPLEVLGSPATYVLGCHDDSNTIWRKIASQTERDPTVQSQS